MTLKIGEGPLAIPGYTNEQIEYHLYIMGQGDLFSYGGIADDRVSVQNFGGLRWRGHEFLDDVRNPEAWADTMGKVEKYGGAGLEVAWELAKAYMRSHGLPF
jgi:hypothetical protein